MDTIKRNKLRRQIQIAASLTSHQASKVTGAVLTVLGGKNVENMIIHTNRQPKDCALAPTCIHRPNCAGCTKFKPVANASESHGPTQKEKSLDSIFAGDTASKEIIRAEKVERKPEDCALHPSCSGTYCTGCPSFKPILGKKSAVEHLVDSPVAKEIKELDAEIKKYNDLEGDPPPFELEEDVVQKAEDKAYEEQYVILSKQEFELIRHTLKGAIKSTINEKVNVLRKYGDNPEQFEIAIEDVRIISKLISRLDKL